MLNDKIKDILLYISIIVMILLFFYANILANQKEQLQARYSALELEIKNTQKEIKKDTEIVERTITKIEKVYVPKIQYVKEFVKDTNETDCNASNRLLSNFEY